MRQQQRGGTILGFILGLLVGLGAAFAVAVYVSKIPVPFLTMDGDKTASPRMPQADWNPNTALGGKVTPPPVAPVEVKPEGVAPTETPAAQATASNDPLGDLAKAQIAKAEKAEKAEAAEKAKAAASDGFVYFVQVGAFRSQADADAQRAKLGLIGQQARVSEREQNGRPVYRVRIGPMAQRSEAEALKQQLGDTGIDAALVRIHQ
ncbi:SPOR domain-containing protein [Comamonas denitrificans]|uniref:SPOR domain-containing protein n=1 Tax=Comamonas denitrificans TaxID=117506 RepID=UPI003608301B